MSLRCFLIVCVCLTVGLSEGLAQRVVGRDTLYGNEWLTPGQTYYKLRVGAAGLVSVSGEQLAALGVPTQSTDPASVTVYRMGAKVPLLQLNSSRTQIDAGDQFVFYTEPNDGTFDLWLDPQDDKLLHPGRSLYSDTITYYLTVEAGSHPRIIQEAGGAQPDLRTSALTAKSAFFFDRSFHSPEVQRYVARSTYQSTEGFINPLANPIRVAAQLPGARSGQLAEVELRYFASGGFNNVVNVAGAVGPLSDTTAPERLLTRTFGYRLEAAGDAVDLTVSSPTANSRIGVGQMSVRYARTPTFAGATTLRGEVDLTVPMTLALSGVPATGSGQAIYAISLSDESQLSLRSIGDSLLVGFGNSGVVDFVVGVAQPARLAPWTYRKTRPSPESDYWLLTSRKLALTPGPIDIIDDYAAYRSSPAGGSHRVTTSYYEDIVDEYGYGIPNHPQAIRSAFHDLRRSTKDLKYMFIVGKGRAYHTIRTPEQLALPANATAFIPTFGSPSSDILFSSSGNVSQPSAAVARLPAESLVEVERYLSKVKRTEGSLGALDQNNFWNRRVLHMGGGNEANQQNRIRTTLLSAAKQFEASPLSGEAVGFYRQSEQPVETSQLTSIFSEINKGVGVVTFFGHGSVGLLDFNIDNPERYNNAARLPIFLALGCLAGDVHTPSKSVTEAFVAQHPTGMSFSGSSLSSALESDIHRVIPVMYKRLGRPWEYDGTIGQIMLSSLLEFRNAAEIPSRTAFLEQFQLIGDPGLRVFVPDGPDFSWDASSLTISPATLTSASRRLDLSIDVINAGRRYADTVAFAVALTNPLGEVYNDTVYIADVGFRTRVSWSHNIEDVTPGNYRIALRLDPQEMVAETVSAFSERNNDLSFAAEPRLTVTAISGAAVPIYPPDRALIDCPSDFIGFSADPTAEVSEYELQISTNERFSELVASQTIADDGGVLAFRNVSLPAGNSYVWRVRPTSLLDGATALPFFGMTCRTPGDRALNYDGLALSSYRQFLGPSSTLNLDTTGRWEFRESVKEIEITNLRRFESDWPRFTENGSFWEANYGNDILAGVYIAVYDTLGLDSYNQPPGGLHGSDTPASWRRRWVFPFKTVTPADREEVVSFLDTVVNEGEYVAFFTIQDASNSYLPKAWVADSVKGGVGLFEYLEKAGATEVRGLLDGEARPYIFVYRKGYGKMEEKLADSPTDTLRVNFTMTGRWFEGDYRSPMLEAMDSVTEVTIVVHDSSAVNPTFRWHLTNTREQQIDTLYAGRELSFMLTEKLVGEELNLRVGWTDRDTLTRRPTQVKAVTVAGRYKPEVVIDHSAERSARTKRAIAFGDSVRFGASLFNASSRTIDSVSFVSYLTSGRGQELASDSFAVRELQPLGSADVSVAFLSKRNVSGSGELRLWVNPTSSLVERNYNNNLIRYPLMFEADDTDPLVRLLVNGDPMLNRQLVSATPTFTVLITDNTTLDAAGTMENWRLVHFDETGQRQLIDLSSESVVLRSIRTGKAELEWSPVNLRDGMHRLQLTVTDLAGNVAGVEVSREFEIVTEQTVSSVLPYPNPAVDNVRFAYELTGGEAVSNYQIDVYTTSGRLVKSLGPADLGTLKPGRGLTENGWNATDHFGQRLARGTYLYRFSILNSKGEVLEHRSTSADAYTKVFGRISLIR